MFFSQFSLPIFSQDKKKEDEIMMKEKLGWISIDFGQNQGWLDE